MDPELYSGMSPKELSKFISRTLLDNLFQLDDGSNIYPSIESLHDPLMDYTGRRCKGYLSKDMGKYNTGELVKIDVKGNNITINSMLNSINQKESISYIVYPEMPILKLTNNFYSLDTPQLEDLKLFFELDLGCHINLIDGLLSTYIAICRYDIGLLRKGGIYTLKINDVCKVCSIDDKFLYYLSIVHPMPILIENKGNKL